MCVCVYVCVWIGLGLWVHTSVGQLFSNHTYRDIWQDNYLIGMTFCITIIVGTQISARTMLIPLTQSYGITTKQLISCIKVLLIILIAIDISFVIFTVSPHTTTHPYACTHVNVICVLCSQIKLLGCA